MPNKPLLVFCIRQLDCPLVEIMNEASGWSPPLNGGGPVATPEIPSLAARVLRVRPYPGEGFTELWLRLSGEREAVSRFMKLLSGLKGIYYQVIYENKFNKILRIVLHHDAPHVCPLAGSGGCPLTSEAPGAMLKSTLIIPGGLLQEYIVARSNMLEHLEKMGCTIVDSRPLDEMDYMLTQKQELAIVYAYLSGYYNFPRKVSLKSLAERLGLSVSTLAEFLRRAEAKVIEAF
ncbi:MAG: hypothetical protein GXO15_01330, partial [Crenarchaeota archaeon]|nr:hypothetical protein [Thermoproteota archaeon]